LNLISCNFKLKKFICTLTYVYGVPHGSPKYYISAISSVMTWVDCTIPGIYVFKVEKVQLSLRLLKQTLEDILGNESTAPRILNFGTRWVVSFTSWHIYPGERAPGTHWIGDWMQRRDALDAMEESTPVKNRIQIPRPLINSLVTIMAELSTYGKFYSTAYLT
jgi:hypothetical protein